MTPPTAFAPVELTEADLDVVSGACHGGGGFRGNVGWSYNGDGSVSIPMSNGATMTLSERGGSIVVDGNGITISGNITLNEVFNASITTDQGVTGIGDVAGNACGC